MSIHRRLLKIVSTIVVITILFSGFRFEVAAAQGPDGVERKVNAETGKVSFLGPESGQVLPASAALGKAVRPQDPAMALAKRFGPEFGLGDPERELTQMKTSRAENGRITARYQQNYQGIPVMGGELIVNTNDNGDLYSMNGEVSAGLSLSTQSTISREQARQTALHAVAKWYQKTPNDLIASEPALWIYDESLLRPSTRPAELVWRTEVTAKGSALPVRELLLVNAHRGSISLHFNQIDTAWSASAQANVPSSNQQLPVLLVATWYVATTGNNANTCLSAGSPCQTINAAIGKASAGDTIRVAVGTYTGTGTEVVLINKGVTLSGGWNAAFTTQSGTSTIDGQATRRGVSSVGENVFIDRFTIQNGFFEFQAGGLKNDGGPLTLSNSVVKGNVTHSSGGGIHNFGTLTINNTTINGNTTGQTNTGGLGGAGIYSHFGTVTLNNSTVSNNVIVGAFSGSGIFAADTLVLNNSTVSGNGGGSGEGIHTFNASLTLRNSTISSNQGYGILFQAGSVTLLNTLIAQNGPNGDCSDDSGYSPTVTSQGYNLIGENADCPFTPATGDLIGTSASPINPRLALLQDNGGSTRTHALMTGSPAINAGSPSSPGSGGTACLATDQRGVSRPVNTRCDIGAYEGSVPFAPVPRVSTYSAGSAYLLPGSFLCNQSDTGCVPGDSHARAVHQYAIGTFNLYATQHNRDSLDDNGMMVISSVHYCSEFECPYDNANWTGEQMIFGDASGWPLADDVVAHEFTHGVTQYESNLFYYYQSGAINESLSDLWGEYYDQTNGLGTDTAGAKWQMSEDVSGLGAIRSMSNPPLFNDPDRMSSVNYYEGEIDNGGVHSNSGVNNKAIYLLVDGGTFNGKTVTALGWQKTAAIYYEANTNLLLSASDYSDLYYALQQACNNLIGQNGITSGNCLEVKDAVDAVEMNAQPAPGFNTEAPFCKIGDPLTTILSDDLESGTGNWTFNNGSFPRWQLDSPFGPFAQSGVHSLYADDFPDEPTDATARLAAFSVPADAYLRFAQAYGFESGFNTGDPTFYHFDGGVLEYSINGGGWLDAGSLIDYNGYRGRIFTGASNPLSGRSAFVGDSHGYISTRLNLTSLAGKTVSFRWRMGLDVAAADRGWWVDDVEVYTCAPPNLKVFIGGTQVGGYTMLPSESERASFAGVNNGPVNISSMNAANLIAAERLIYKFNGVNTSFTEMMGLPNSQLDTTYWLPWYNNVDLDTQLRFANVSNSPATVTISIGGQQMGNPIPLAAGASTRVSFPGVNNGPVKIVSTQNIVAAERLIYRVSGKNTSFSEMMALPNTALDNTYWLPWYNNADLDTQLRFANVSGSPAQVRVFIGGQQLGNPIPLAPGASTRVSFVGVNNGPVQIVSDQNIVAAERLIYKVNGVPTSFTEMMALPDSQLDTTYWLPWYNNRDLDTQLRFANVHASQTAIVHVYIGGVEMPGSPFTLLPGASTRQRFPNINNGPVKIVSNVQIVAAERLIYKVGNVNTSFSEMMALPDSQLDTIYWLPWYNNTDLDTQLRFGVP